MLSCIHSSPPPPPHPFTNLLPFAYTFRYFDLEAQHKAYLKLCLSTPLSSIADLLWLFDVSTKEAGFTANSFRGVEHGVGVSRWVRLDRLLDGLLVAGSSSSSQII